MLHLLPAASGACLYPFFFFSPSFVLGHANRERVNYVSMVYCRFTRKILVAVMERWDSHVLVIDKVAPANWKVEAVIVFKY